MLKNYRWQTLDRKNSQESFEKLVANDFKPYQEISPLRELIASLLRKALSDLNSSDLENNSSDKSRYMMDLDTGLILHTHLNPLEFGLRNAANDGVWRYMSLKELPDLVHVRWGTNEDHFWRKPRRIWLKSMWWYVHLSWQGDEFSTRKILEKKNRSTDTILQLVERSGTGGYRIDLYREIMRQTAINEISTAEFRSIMLLNTARLASVEPEFHEGGIRGYVHSLIERVKRTDGIPRNS